MVRIFGKGKGKPPKREIPQLDSHRSKSRRGFKGHPVRFLEEYSKEVS
jgi:hypothetical protein